MKSKLKFILPLMLLIFGGTYKFVLAKPAPAPKSKIAGEIYVLPTAFTVNLAGSHLAKLSVALVLHHGFTATPAEGAHGSAAPTVEGYGVLAQEAVVRNIVTDTVTDEPASALQSRKGRHKLETEILERIGKTTDVKVEEVLFTDVAVQ
jgi:flagellar FliL protein